MNQKGIEKVNCAVCGSNNSKIACLKDGFNIVRCTDCGLYYVNPRLKRKKLSELYNNDEISPVDYYIETKKADEKTFRKRLKAIEKTLGRKGQILDIGCNIGTLLFVAKDLGWECFGLDINKKVREYFVGSGIDLKIGDVLEVKYPRRHFDVVVMNDLIEHVPDPKSTLLRVREWLRDDGVIFLVTPDGGSLMFSLLGKRWFHLKPNEHIYYFTKKSLSRLLTEAGFEIVFMRHLGRRRSFKTLAMKSASVTGILSSVILKAFRWMRLSSLDVPFNLYDEYGVIAKKKR